MPVTSLIVTDAVTKEKKYIQITTEPNAKVEGLLVMVHNMDPEFEFHKGTDIGSDPRTEEEYHTELRTMAAEKEQLITSHSTNPEWNPEGYIKNLKNGSL